MSRAVQHQTGDRADGEEQVVEALVVGHRPDDRGVIRGAQAEAAVHRGTHEDHALHDEEEEVGKRGERYEDLRGDRHALRMADGRVVGGRAQHRPTAGA